MEARLMYVPPREMFPEDIHLPTPARAPIYRPGTQCNAQLSRRIFNYYFSPRLYTADTRFRAVYVYVIILPRVLIQSLGHFVHTRAARINHCRESFPPARDANMRGLNYIIVRLCRCSFFFCSPRRGYRARDISGSAKSSSLDFATNVN